MNAPLRGSTVTFIPGGRLLPLSSDWRVRFVTDGSVSRHWNRKSSPSLRSGLTREVTNTVKGLVRSGRGTLLETGVEFVYI